MAKEDKNTEIVVKDKKKTAFMNRRYSRSEEDIAAEKAELDTLVEENKAASAPKKATKPETPENDKDEDKDLSVEETSFKKRYGDLRRHNQKQKDDFDKRIRELETQVKEVTKKGIKLPKSEEELEEWAEEYPDVAKIIETIAMKKSAEQNKDLEDKLKDLSAMQDDTRRERSETDLLKFHPDFEEIRELDKFHEWSEMQPKWVQDALYDNDHDARSTARAIDLFKIDVEWDKKEPNSTPVEEEKDAAKVVDTHGERTTPTEERDNDMILESEIDALSAAEYEAQEELIAEAIRNGKVIYDISGAAR